MEKHWPRILTILSAILILWCAATGRATEPPCCLDTWDQPPTARQWLLVAGEPRPGIDQAVVARSMEREAWTLQIISDLRDEVDAMRLAAAADAKVIDAQDAELVALRALVAQLESQAEPLRLEVLAANERVIRLPAPGHRAWKTIGLVAIGVAGGAIATEAMQ